MIVLDTNALIRFVLCDNKPQAKRVRQLLESKKIIFIPDVVFPELEYVLTGNYRFTKKQLLKFFRFLLTQKNIRTNTEAKKGVNLFETTKLDMADCLISAYSLKGQLASFDKDLIKATEKAGYWK